MVGHAAEAAGEVEEFASDFGDLALARQRFDLVGDAPVMGRARAIVAHTITLASTRNDYAACGLLYHCER